MKGVVPVVALLTVSGVVVGCSRPPRLVGEVEVTASPIVARFEQPVPTGGPAWELCFEFDLPRDSHAAEGIQAVLLTAAGGRHRLAEPTLDRRGEANVCQVGRMVAQEPGDATAGEPSIVFEAIEVSAATPMRLRAIRGGSRT